MIDINLRLVFLVFFLGALTAFLYWDRNKIERHFILFYRRTERGIDLIDRIASRLPRLWKAYGWLGVFTGFVSMVLSAALFGQVILEMLKTKSAANGPSLILPGLVSESQFQAGVSFIPVEYWIAGIGVLMVVHEMSHGIVARVEDFELNSVGWIVLGIFPGAFVEPKGENMLPGDEENEDPDTGMWEQGSWTSRLKVLGAGSLANYLTAALFLLFAIGVSGAVTQPSNVFYAVDDGFPASNAGMTNGSLYQINEVTINSVEDLQTASSQIEVGDSVSIWTSEGNFTVEATNKTGYEGGYIGIRVGQATEIKPSLTEFQGPLQWFVSLLWTVGILNLLIGLFNMLPFKPLDGGLMLETVVERYLPGKEKYVNTFSLMGMALILTALVFAIGAGFL